MKRSCTKNPKKRSTPMSSGGDSMDQSSGKRRGKDVIRVIDENVNKKRKKRGENVGAIDETLDVVDHISRLPDCIIHDILSRLLSTKEAARISILSKRWNSVWLSYSGLEFDERKFHKHVLKKKAREKLRVNEKTMFKDFVEKSIQTRFKENSCVHKLALHVCSYDLELSSRLNNWIGLAVQNDVPELDLCVSVEKKWHYSLPRAVLSSASITALRLRSCKWKASSNIHLPNLKRLCLRQLHINEEKIESLVVSCPSLEDMRFIKCNGLRSLQLTSHKLDRVEVHQCPGLENIVLEAKNLSTFWFSGKKSETCNIKLTASKSLKSLSLEDPKITEASFQNYLSEFPFLEKLEISKGNLLKNITILSVYMRKVVLRDCENLVSADFDTPNLRSFEFTGDDMPFSLDPFSLEEAKLSIHLTGEIGRHDTSKYDKVEEFLKKFDSSKGLKLATYSRKVQKNCYIHEDFTEILLPHEKDLDVVVLKPSTSMEGLFDRVLELCQPRFLNIVSPQNSKFTPRIEDMLWECKDPSCSKYESNRGWRSQFSGARSMDGCFGYLSNHPYHMKEQKLTCFKLFWKCGRSRKKSENA